MMLESNQIASGIYLCREPAYFETLVIRGQARRLAIPASGIAVSTAHPAHPLNDSSFFAQTSLHRSFSPRYIWHIQHQELGLCL